MINLSLSRTSIVYRDGKRGELIERHKTAHYTIKEWVLPIESDDMHQFHISGPGNSGRCYLALSPECGPQFIQALERAYMAGTIGGFNFSNIPNVHYEHSRFAECIDQVHNQLKRGFNVFIYRHEPWMDDTNNSVATALGESPTNINAR